LAQPAWTLFHSNQTAWKAIFELCEEARHTLALEQYIFAPDGIGGRLLDLLTSRAKAGVDVRMVLDGFGSSRVPTSEKGRALVKAGGRIAMYNGARDVLFHPYGHLHRLHRKSVLADRRRLILGGCCYHDRMCDWRDTMVSIEGAPVPAAVIAMDILWRRVTAPRTPQAEPAHSPPIAPGDWAYMVSTPYKPAQREFYRTLIGVLSHAQQSITLTTPYFVPDIAFRRALNGALKRGVQVRLIIPHPKKNDHPVWNVPARLFAGRLAERGAEIWLYRPAMMHAKIAVVDDDWASVGSTNLDLLSFALNLENGIVSRARDFHGALLEQLDRDIAQSVRL
jgi:cardiolipin synthase